MTVANSRTYSEEQYNNMDCIVNVIYRHFAVSSKDYKGIQFTNFNFYNKEHLLLLSIAYIYRRMSNKEIKIHKHKFKTIKWNWSCRKKEQKIYSRNTLEKNYLIIDAENFLECFPPKIEQYLKGFTYSDIYDAYFNTERVKS